MTVKHPHFDRIEDKPNAYVSRATGLCVLVIGGGSSYRAVPATINGERLPVHAEPMAWAETEWEVLDAVHAQR